MKKLLTFCSLLVIAGIVFTGCDKNSTEPEDTTILYEDAAESISAATGDESGGAMESFADISAVAGGASVSTSLAKSSGESSVMTVATPAEYDPITGWWSVTINRSRSGIIFNYNASVQRVYQYQFQKNGVFQQNRISGNDTANTLKFKIISGSGFFRNANVHHNLTQLKGAWTATKIDKDTIVLNSDTTYVRSGIDSIITRNMIRTFTHTTTMEFSNVKGLRFRPSIINWRSNFHQAVSGTINGTYNAAITFERGTAYKERTINKTFTIILGSGDGSLTINGGGKFGMNLQEGKRK
ncbi:MAG TPA: hypothetical protein DCQ28_05375 [Bacteroidetes bacterium]|nr:hypothetical protein [Bacteroidota bacterium]